MDKLLGQDHRDADGVDRRSAGEKLLGVDCRSTPHRLVGMPVVINLADSDAECYKSKAVANATFATADEGVRKTIAEADAAHDRKHAEIERDAAQDTAAHVPEPTVNARKDARKQTADAEANKIKADANCKRAKADADRRCAHAVAEAVRAHRVAEDERDKALAEVQTHNVHTADSEAKAKADIAALNANCDRAKAEASAAADKARVECHKAQVDAETKRDTEIAAAELAAQRAQNSLPTTPLTR
jgi:hypothetical protein